MHAAAAYTEADFRHSPLLVFYEITRACDLICKHCRASAQPKRHPQELDNAQSKALIDQVRQFPKPPMLVLTGGDPMKREDLYDVIRYAVAGGLNVAMTPSATPLVTAEAVRELKSSGVSRLAMSIDGADARTHDEFRGVNGSFARTLEIMAHARECRLPLQVNSTITKRNFRQVDAMAALLATQGIVLWSVFFLIPVGRGLSEERIAAEEYEYVFERLWDNAQRQRFGIKTTEAHHYRRFVLERDGDPQRNPEALKGAPPQRAPLGVNDGKGVMFVSHTGRIHPSGFMPIPCGSFPEQSVVEVYQDNEVFRRLRDGNLLGGKCGVCEYRQVCGGSRARAYAVSGDPLAPEPDCVYIPPAWV